jgi:hypothetical protein
LPNSLPFSLLLASLPVAESRMTQPCVTSRDAPFAFAAQRESC